MTATADDLRRAMGRTAPRCQEEWPVLFRRHCLARGFDPLTMPDGELTFLFDQFDRRMCKGMRLRDNFGLTDREIGNYRCRAAISTYEALPATKAERRERRRRGRP